MTKLRGYVNVVSKLQSLLPQPTVNLLERNYMKSLSALCLSPHVSRETAKVKKTSKYN